MKGLTLDKELEPGTYSVVMVYHLVDDDENEVSTLNVGLDIHVEYLARMPIIHTQPRPTPL